jgi:hypothetical protein
MTARDGFERALMWMRAIVFRRRFEREMREEMAQHLERSTMRLTARGLEAEDARREAMREFGNIAWLQEEARYARGVVWLDAMKADLRFATRHFARTPWTTMAILVVLVVGMSVSTLLFAGIHSYAFAPPIPKNFSCPPKVSYSFLPATLFSIFLNGATLYNMRVMNLLLICGNILVL